MSSSTGIAPSGKQADHREALWNAMLDAHLNVCYWSIMSRRSTRLDLSFKIFLAIATSGTVAAWGIWEQVPMLWKTISALACIAGLAQPILSQTERIKRMSALLGTWKELLNKYELLWEQDPHLRDTKNWKQYEAIQGRRAKIDETRLPFSERTRWKAAAEVRKARGLPESGK